MDFALHLEQPAATACLDSTGLRTRVEALVHGLAFTEQGTAPRQITISVSDDGQGAMVAVVRMNDAAGRQLGARELPPEIDCEALSDVLVLVISTLIGPLPRAPQTGAVPSSSRPMAPRAMPAEPVAQLQGAQTGVPNAAGPSRLSPRVARVRGEGSAAHDGIRPMPRPDVSPPSPPLDWSLLLASTADFTVLPSPAVGLHLGTVVRHDRLSLEVATAAYFPQRQDLGNGAHASLFAGLLGANACIRATPVGPVGFWLCGSLEVGWLRVSTAGLSAVATRDATLLRAGGGLRATIELSPRVQALLDGRALVPMLAPRLYLVEQGGAPRYYHLPLTGLAVRLGILMHVGS